MPWIAVNGDQKEVPEEVEDGETVYCPDCDNEMFPRGPTSDGRARHFAHKSSGGDGGSGSCGGGGESDIHRRWKSFSKSRVKQLFSNEFLDEITLEKSVPLFDSADVRSSISDSNSKNQTREADVFVSLADEHHKIGRGIAIEVQYKNKTKDIEATEADYLAEGISVLWLDEDDFVEDRCTVSRSQFLTRLVTVFPKAVPRSHEWKTPEFDIPNSLVGRNTDSYVQRHQRLRLELDVDRPSNKTRVSMPASWYKEIAERYYEETAWGELFHTRSYESYLTEFRIGTEKEALAKIPLKKWLDDDELAIAHVTTTSVGLAYINYNELSKSYIWDHGNAPAFLRDSDVSVFNEPSYPAGNYSYDWFLIPDSFDTEHWHERRPQKSNGISQNNNKTRDTGEKFDITGKNARSGNEQKQKIEYECPNCGSSKTRLGILSGETQRSSCCGSCGTWFMIYSDGNGLENATEIVE